jgi:hypothetical protein
MRSAAASGDVRAGQAPDIRESSMVPSLTTAFSNLRSLNFAGDRRQIFS